MLDKQQILSNFPNIKLSYENVIHKKVFNSNYMVAIPTGKKCFVWFTTVNGKPACLLLELSNDKQIEEIKTANIRFSQYLAPSSSVEGTIFYGTKFYYSGMNFFSIEDIFSNKGRPIYKETWQDKLEQIKYILENDIHQKSYNGYITFGLPIMSTNINDFEIEVQKVGYKIDNVQFKLYNKCNSYLVLDYRKFNYKPADSKENIVSNNNYNLMAQFGLVQSKPNANIESNKTHIVKEKKQYVEKKREATFTVRADIQADIYNLFYLDSKTGKEEFEGLAHIPDYKTSVMMNSLFRIIKENVNLDALEESDDEEEFEDENEDKFVHLDKEYKMICEYNYKFKKWVPIKIAS
jgi:hypothetical protein